jgi:hypothetical protein
MASAIATWPEKPTSRAAIQKTGERWLKLLLPEFIESPSLD